ncbi:glycosyltransferase family 61 protein [Flexibacterium corallicola]|uniref:glycosyltransferase family 61 protein n=1 Tax=Flexibacterium corallicola TaxID=3037259 RepID=UPI00286EE20B|nr:glycosyltransferase family 61 protein [Pseudovibrio sp. M1P-2-3]
MRQAPKWRSWFPTGREIRFFIQSTIAKLFPTLALRYNFVLKQMDWDQVDQTEALSWADYSEVSLSEELHDFLQDFGDNEKQRTGGKTPKSAHLFARVYEFKNVYVLGHTGSNLLKDERCQVEALSKNTMRFQTMKDRHIKGYCLNLLGVPKGHRHYYFFHCLFMPSFLQFLDGFSSRYEKLTILVREDLSGFQKTFYKQIESWKPNVRFEIINTTERVLCDELVYLRGRGSSKFRSPYSQNAMELVAGVYRAAYELSALQKPFRKIYVCRQDAKIRQVLNEQKLIDLLGSYGFEVVTPGNLSHKEQVKVFSEAKIVVGVHGAGLTNLMFTQPEGHVIEIFPADYIQGAYTWMSTLKEHQYTPIVGSKSLGHQNFSLTEENLSELESILSGHTEGEAAQVA